MLAKFSSVGGRKESYIRAYLREDDMDLAADNVIPPSLVTRPKSFGAELILAIGRIRVLGVVTSASLFDQLAETADRLILHGGWQLVINPQTEYGILVRRQVRDPRIVVYDTTVAVETPEGNLLERRDVLAIVGCSWIDDLLGEVYHARGDFGASGGELYNVSGRESGVERSDWDRGQSKEVFNLRTIINKTPKITACHC